ncbi:hypothetical protein AX15_006394 [Amanita polypyramis BW_CC]|nr:hypothetical protein AX15_006394 [Amanita polypyramis BW_CC]
MRSNPVCEPLPGSKKCAKCYRDHRVCSWSKDAIGSSSSENREDSLTKSKSVVLSEDESDSSVREPSSPVKQRREEGTSTLVMGDQVKQIRPKCTRCASFSNNPICERSDNPNDLKCKKCRRDKQSCSFAPFGRPQKVANQAVTERDVDDRESEVEERGWEKKNTDSKEKKKSNEKEQRTEEDRMRRRRDEANIVGMPKEKEKARVRTEESENQDEEPNDEAGRSEKAKELEHKMKSKQKELKMQHAKTEERANRQQKELVEIRPVTIVKGAEGQKMKEGEKSKAKARESQKPRTREVENTNEKGTGRAKTKGVENPNEKKSKDKGREKDKGKGKEQITERKTFKETSGRGEIQTGTKRKAGDRDLEGDTDERLEIPRKKSKANTGRSRASVVNLASSSPSRSNSGVEGSSSTNIPGPKAIDKQTSSTGTPSSDRVRTSLANGSRKEQLSNRVPIVTGVPNIHIHRLRYPIQESDDTLDEQVAVPASNRNISMVDSRNRPLAVIERDLSAAEYKASSHRAIGESYLRDAERADQEVARLKEELVATVRRKAGTEPGGVVTERRRLIEMLGGQDGE